MVLRLTRLVCSRTDPTTGKKVAVSLSQGTALGGLTHSPALCCARGRGLVQTVCWGCRGEMGPGRQVGEMGYGRCWGTGGV